MFLVYLLLQFCLLFIGYKQLFRTKSYFAFAKNYLLCYFMHYPFNIRELQFPKRLKVTSAAKVFFAIK